MTQDSTGLDIRDRLCVGNGVDGDSVRVTVGDAVGDSDSAVDG